MPSYYKGTIPILDDFGTKTTDLTHPKGVRFGMTPRDYSLFPEEMLAGPESIKVIPQSEWDSRYDEEEQTESSLEHKFLRGGQPAFVNLDQNGDGYCWDYSNGHGFMMTRLRDGMPVVRVNPHASAAIIKGGRDEGGWCGLGAQFAKEHGWALEGTGVGQWPLHSRNLKYDTPSLRAEMAKLKVQEDVYDLTRRVWDQSLTTLQLATCGFNNIPAPSDFNWWGHSVCQIRWVRIERGSWGPLILNSWKGWGRFGLAVLRGSQAIANGAVAVRY